MQDIARFTESIFEVTADTFAGKALAIFNYQAKENAVYRDFLQYLDISPSSVKSISDIPFLPISAFKHHKVVCGGLETDTYFESSGTTDSQRSRHYIVDRMTYENSYLSSFRQVYGDPINYRILALLPSYLERSNASLVDMCRGLIERSGHPESGFYLHDLQSLSQVLSNDTGIKTILIGVSFALLDLAEQFPQSLANTIIMETGGMKGRRSEITREALHGVLRNAFNVDVIHSEYGMTELFSQAYSTGYGIFQCPPWMRIIIRDSEDPLQLLETGKTGGVNIIDLANLHSCSFIATDDLGSIQQDNRFSIAGRFDNSDIRGCNLMTL